MGAASRYDITKEDAKFLLIQKIYRASDSEVEELLRGAFPDENLKQFNIVDEYDNENQPYNFSTHPIT